jgi:hypothetical protein
MHPAFLKVLPSQRKGRLDNQSQPPLMITNHNDNPEFLVLVRTSFFHLFHPLL